AARTAVVRGAERHTSARVRGTCENDPAICRLSFSAISTHAPSHGWEGCANRRGDALPTCIRLPVGENPAMETRLIDAYLRTTYWVEASDGWIAVAIGERSAPLDRLLARSGAATWAIVTADNPGSRPLPPADNA